MQQGLEALLAEKLAELGPDWRSIEFLSVFVKYFGDHRSFYKSYIQSSLGQSWVNGSGNVWEKHLRPMFLSHGVLNERHMMYYYEAYRAAVMTVVKSWLECDCQKPPEEIASMIINVLGEDL